MSTASSIIQKVTDDIEEHLTRSLESIISGTPKDYPDYRYLCGLIEGYRTTLRQIETVVNDLNRQEGM